MADAVTEVDVLQQRLQAWAAWLAGGNAGAGYPTKNVLHSSWLPPAPGGTALGGRAAGRHHAREQHLHELIRQELSVRLQNTLVVVYLMRAQAAEQARLLECQPSTVRARVREAKAIIGRSMQ